MPFLSLWVHIYCLATCPSPASFFQMVPHYPSSYFIFLPCAECLPWFLLPIPPLLAWFSLCLFCFISWGVPLCCPNIFLLGMLPYPDSSITQDRPPPLSIVLCKFFCHPLLGLDLLEKLAHIYLSIKPISTLFCMAVFDIGNFEIW